MALMLAARRPELFAGISVWCAMTDLEKWHSEMLTRGSDNIYAAQMEGALGSPDVNSLAYLTASPINFCKELRLTRIDLNAGLTDGHHGTVFVAHSLRLFNSIANSDDLLSQIDFERLTQGKKELFSNPVKDDAYENKEVLFRRISGKIRLTVFNGDHEMIPFAAIEWLAKQQ